MLPLVSGNNSRLPSVNHALISPVRHHAVLWVALPPLVPSIHHSHYPSPLHSFTPGLKPSFSANPSHWSLPFLLQEWLCRLFTVTSEHIRFLLFSFVFYTCYSSVPCGRVSRLVSAFERTLKYHLVSFRLHFVRSNYCYSINIEKLKPIHTLTFTDKNRKNTTKSDILLTNRSLEWKRDDECLSGV